MNNRLGELQSWAAEDVDVESGEKNGDDGDNFGNESVADSPAQPKHMDSFFREVESIKADIEGVRQATKRIGEINEEAVLATSDAKEHQLSDELRPLISETNAKAKRTKNLIGLHKEENEKLKKGGKVNESDMR